MSQTGVVSWSQTAASNATADSNVNWAEGMAPSQVNDSARAQMASVAKWRDDLSGALVTGGTSAAYTLTSNQSFSSLTVLNGQKLKVVSKVNPEIKGGLIVEIGDRTIDLSVSSKMAKMNKLLKDTL